MNQNKKIILVGLVFVLAMLLIGQKTNQKFYLNENYYGVTSMEEIDIEKLNELRDSKDSFTVFVYQPSCTNSENFEKVLKEFQEEKKIKIYKIAFSLILESDLKDTVKYYPSFLIYKEGKLINYLKADKDSHKEYYKSKEEFTKWFTKYVYLKQIEEQNINVSNSELEAKYIKEIDFDSIKKEKDKVNVYLFWGNGCPHCASELAFLDSLEEEYKNKINLYPLEVWYNEENASLLKEFAAAMEDTVKGVPYTIIGSLSFKGYGSGREEEIKKAIDEESKKDFDVYLDKIKPEKDK